MYIDTLMPEEAVIAHITCCFIVKYDTKSYFRGENVLLK